MAAVPVIQCRHEFTLASQSGHSANKSHKIRQGTKPRKNTWRSIGAQLRPSVWSSFVHSDTVQRKTAKWECKPFVGENKLPSDRIQSFLVRCTHIMSGYRPAPSAGTGNTTHQLAVRMIHHSQPHSLTGVHQSPTARRGVLKKSKESVFGNCKTICHGTSCVRNSI